MAIFCLSLAVQQPLLTMASIDKLADRLDSTDIKPATESAEPPAPAASDKPAADTPKDGDKASSNKEGEAPKNEGQTSMSTAVSPALRMLY